MLAPVAVFAYKRMDKLEKCLESLDKCYLSENSDLYIFSDGYKGTDDKILVEETRDFIRYYSKNSRFNSVNLSFSDHNKGLAGSIISGVSTVIKKFGRIIVVEDDLVVSEDFLIYLNGALDYYNDDKRYGSISAYSYPLKSLKNYDMDVYAMRKGECWGWGTWSDRWQDVDWQVSDFDKYFNSLKMRHDFDSLEIGLDSMLCNQVAGRIDSWAVRWLYHLYKHNYFTVYPRFSKTSNNGFDNSGIHCDSTDKYQISLINEKTEFEFNKVIPVRRIEAECRYYPAGLLERIKYILWYYNKSLLH